ncbi:MAG: YidC/Oxa1 family insertase periplasmic-domain containing protein, partial [Planctomycetota bacterium]
FDNQSALPFATRGIYWTIGQSEKPEPLWAPRTGGQGWIAKDLIEDEDSQSLPFEYKIQRNGREFLTVTKTYTVRKGDYSFTLELKVQNHSTQTVNVCLDQLGPTGVPKEDYDKDVRQIVYAQLSPDGEVQPTLVAAPGNGVYEDVPLNDRKYVSGQGKDPIWVGVMNKYFASLVYLESGSDATLANLGDDPEFYYGALKESQTSQALFAGLMIGSKDLSDETTIEQGVSLAKSMKLDRPEQVARIRPSLVIKPNGVQTVSMNVFCGPKKRDIFTDEENHPLYAQLNYLSTIDVSSCCPVSVDFLAIGMMWLLQTFSVVALGNWGIAIILLVLLVRLVLHPLSKKSQTSMAKMQKLGPQVKKVQEKYKDDKATMQKEVMKIYREAGASPFLGCLPMFLQIPIWIALWTAVRVSVELRHAAFLPVWLTDLSTPDQLIEFGQALPIIGSSFNLLPILLGVAMYLQMKLSPQMAGGAGGATTPEQQAQQKMMQFLMPGMMLMFFYNAPAGLTLYIMASTFVGVMESKIIRKHIREKEAAEAAAETVVQGPGKGARSSRPKKPKGPFWHKNG